MKKLFVIGLISSSLVLGGCFKQETVPEVQKQIQENIQSGVVQNGSVEITKPIETNSGVIEQVSTGSVSENGNTSNSVVSIYPGCDISDIKLSNGQVWSACNIGSTVAGTGTNSYGTLHQWGRNDGGWSGNNPDWQVRNDNSWGGIGTTVTEGVWLNVSDSNKTLMKGLCAENYHIPTIFEWISATNSITGKSSKWEAQDITSFQNTLKLPMSGYRDYYDDLVHYQGQSGYYWSSSPNVDRVLGAYSPCFLDINSVIMMVPADNNNRAFAYPIRCIKN